MTPSISLVVKLASIAVHIEEGRSFTGHQFDWNTVDSLLTDPEVRAFLDDPANAAFLPKKRTILDLKGKLAQLGKLPSRQPEER